MPHPYTTAARVRAFAVAQHVDRWLDRDGDGLHDEGQMADAIARAGNTIDARLGRRYELPLRTRADASLTPGKAADICDRLTVVYLLEPITGAAEEAAHHWKVAQGELDALASGADFLNAVEVSAASRRPVRYQSGGLFVAGTDGGAPRTRGM